MQLKLATGVYCAFRSMGSSLRIKDCKEEVGCTQVGQKPNTNVGGGKQGPVNYQQRTNLASPVSRMIWIGETL